MSGGRPAKQLNHRRRRRQRSRRGQGKRAWSERERSKAARRRRKNGYLIRSGYFAGEINQDPSANKAGVEQRPSPSLVSPLHLALAPRSGGGLRLSRRRLSRRPPPPCPPGLSRRTRSSCRRCGTPLTSSPPLSTSRSSRTSQCQTPTTPMSHTAPTRTPRSPLARRVLTTAERRP